MNPMTIRRGMRTVRLPLPSGSQKPLTSKRSASEVQRYRHFAYDPPCWRGYLLVRSKSALRDYLLGQVIGLASD
jgi:hypothetical protein